MSTKQEFIDAVIQLKQGNYLQVLNGAALDFYTDCSKRSNWAEVSSVSHSLMSYLYDLIEHDFDKGCKMIITFFVGYPNHDYTALYNCVWDVISTQRVVLENQKYFKDLKMTRNQKHTYQSLMINTYMRWICIVYETYRKFLVFDLFCLKATLNETWDIDFLLYKSSPKNKLEQYSNIQSKPLIDAFNGATRHSISHGNAFIFPSNNGLHEIFIQESVKTNNQYSFTRKKYSDVLDFHNNEIDTTYVIFEAMNLAFQIFSNLVGQHTDSIKSVVGEISFTDPVTLLTYENVKAGKF